MCVRACLFAAWCSQIATFKNSAPTITVIMLLGDAGDAGNFRLLFPCGFRKFRANCFLSKPNQANKR